MHQPVLAQCFCYAIEITKACLTFDLPCKSNIAKLVMQTCHTVEIT